jgi:DTW domain-containing protein YfiP
MNLQDYLDRRMQQIMEQPEPRSVCLTCFQVKGHCYCTDIQKFDSDTKFVILIHPIELKRRIASGRMSHLCLNNSNLITTSEHRGHNYNENKEVNKILNDPGYYSVLLYPGTTAVNLTQLSQSERYTLTPKGKKLAVFVVDGTWNTARKTVYHSANLKILPRICFTPPRASQFRVRKQPHPDCFSTLEAIHHTIELVGDSAAIDRRHDHLLYVFNRMVERQLTFVQSRSCRHRRYNKSA